MASPEFLIAAERAKRMAGIDAEAALVEDRVMELEKDRAAREAKVQAKLDAKEAAGGTSPAADLCLSRSEGRGSG